MVDEAGADFMQWVEAQASERVIGEVKGKQPDPKKHEGWVPKYRDLSEILDAYAGREPDAEVVDTAELDALVAEMEAQAGAAF
jgi:hypothetical protein